MIQTPQDNPYTLQGIFKNLRESWLRIFELCHFEGSSAALKTLNKKSKNQKNQKSIITLSNFVEICSSVQI